MKAGLLLSSMPSLWLWPWEEVTEEVTELTAEALLLHPNLALKLSGGAWPRKVCRLCPAWGHAEHSSFAGVCCQLGVSVLRTCCCE